MLLPGEVRDLSLWDQVDIAGAERVARMLGQRLREPWHFVGVQEHQAGGQQRLVAFFDWKGTEFALIPGGKVLLGYDSSRPPDLTEQDLEDWEIAKGTYGNLEEHVRATMTPLHQAVLAPFLLEVASREMNWEPYRHPSGFDCMRSVQVTIGQIHDRLHTEGFRLPTSDEWEHACRAGTRTFWWWGNVSTPQDGELLPPRNGFGLQIAWNSYRSEWCTTPHVFRGGDGGCACCGGLDGLPTALRLASAYFESISWKDDSECFMGDCRRIFPLCDD